MSRADSLALQNEARVEGLAQRLRRGRRSEIPQHAADLRAKAARFQVIAAELEHAADLLEAEIHGTGKEILRGRDLVDELLKYIEPGEELHYRDAERRLLAAGFTAGGKVPLNTLLAQINRAPEFEQTRRRSGIYRRIESEVVA